MHNKIFGFSLIELMVAIAIIGILTSIATPVYLNYTIKAKITNALPILEGLKNKVSDFYVANNRFPIPINDIDITYSDNMISTTNVTNTSSYNGITVTGILGSVQVTFSTDAAHVPKPLQGRIMALVAIDKTNAITWKCVSGDSDGNNKIESSYLPSTCK